MLAGRASDGLCIRRWRVRIGLIYYADHVNLDENEIKILSKKGKTFQVQWTGITKDMNQYDGSKPKTRVEIEAMFTLTE